MRITGLRGSPSAPREGRLVTAHLIGEPRRSHRGCEKGVQRQKGQCLVNRIAANIPAGSQGASVPRVRQWSHRRGFPHDVLAEILEFLLLMLLVESNDVVQCPNLCLWTETRQVLFEIRSELIQQDIESRVLSGTAISQGSDIHYGSSRIAQSCESLVQQPVHCRMDSPIAAQGADTRPR